MIKLETTFSCACPATKRVVQLDAADWETAFAEARLLYSRNGRHDRYIVCNIELIEYDETGCLADGDLVSHEWRKIG